MNDSGRFGLDCAMAGDDRRHLVLDTRAATFAISLASPHFSGRLTIGFFRPV